MRLLIKHTCAGLVLASLSLIWASPSVAAPHFARALEKSCSYCHTAWPQLNSRGREFKKRGYRLPTQETAKLSDVLKPGGFPISALLIARPYDKQKTGDEKIRALHEVEVIIAGAIADKWSGYFEIEAEDENDFEPEIAPAVLTYNHNLPLNLQMAWAPYFWSDPYGLLGDHFRLTRGHVKFIDERFGGADGNGRLRDTRQALSVWGSFNRVFYTVGYGGLAGDSEGENPNNAFGRIAVDITDDIMVGGFGISGKDESTSQDFDRFGLDFQADIGDARLQGAYLKAKDDNEALTDEVKNDSFALQGMYVFKSKTGKPTWVPLVRFDNYERNDGADSYDELVLNLGYYFTDNVKGYVEYWDQLSVPDGVEKNNRFTVQIHVGF